MEIRIDKEGKTPMYLQISRRIREMILSGTLPAGFRLPPERKLAEELQVNRTTVLNAYRELKSGGFVDSHIGQGTTVTLRQASEDTVWESGGSGTPDMPSMPWEQLFSESSLRIQDTTVRDLLGGVRSDMILFAAGVTVPGHDSLEALKRIQAEVLESSGRIAVQHTPTEGLFPLRESICELMRERGINAKAAETMVLTGSQQGLDLIARAFIEAGDVVLAEEPTFFSAVHIFKAAGARVVGIPADNEGMRTDLLDMLVKRFKPKLIYTIPDFQNPSGAVMSMERRKTLLSVASRNQVVILEDDPYGLLRYEGKAMPALKAMDIYGNVLYLSTFSKLMFPGFRVGWLTAPPQVLYRLTMLKQMADLHTSSLPQLIIDRFLREGLIKEHLEKANKENRSRRDLMVSELESSHPDGMGWNRPEGGLYLWCRLPERVPQSRLLASSMERGVSFVPGDVFFPGSPLGNYIRLNYTYPTSEQIVEGVKRLMASYAGIAREQKKYGTGIANELGPII
ncbi:MAG TPA: PLP-dependent aminotransferase family protein [Clostridia bacterium]|nr:PLP-dependent aminotransferase family protein [Clostridia bacterium]